MKIRRTNLKPNDWQVNVDVRGGFSLRFSDTRSQVAREVVLWFDRWVVSDLAILLGKVLRSEKTEIDRLIAEARKGIDP
jgi:hypothetical protein